MRQRIGAVESFLVCLAFSGGFCAYLKSIFFAAGIWSNAEVLFGILIYAFPCLWYLFRFGFELKVLRILLVFSLVFLDSIFVLENILNRFRFFRPIYYLEDRGLYLVPMIGCIWLGASFWIRAKQSQRISPQ